MAPAPATANKMTTQSTSVSGKGEKDAIVEVYKGKTKYVTGKVSSNNSYSIKIVKQKKGTVLTVYLKDKAGNKSRGITVKVS
nr:Ig-like domain-containing protein [Macrococcus carouselicus]